MDSEIDRETAGAGPDCCSPWGVALLPDAERIRDWWELQRAHFPGFELLPHLERLLAEGEPVAHDRLAAAAS